MFASRKNGSGGNSPARFWTAAASPSSGGAAMASLEEVYQWLVMVWYSGMVDGGGAGIVYEYESINGAPWTVSFGPLGPIAGMSDGWRSGSGEDSDSAAVFRTGAASRAGVTWAARGVGAAGGEIRLTNGFIPATMLQERLYVIQRVQSLVYTYTDTSWRKTIDFSRLMLTNRKAIDLAFGFFIYCSNFIAIFSQMKGGNCCFNLVERGGWVMVCRMDRRSHLRSGSFIVLTLKKNAHVGIEPCSEIFIYFYSIIYSA